MTSRSLVRTASISVSLALAVIAFVAVSGFEPLLSPVAEAQDQTGGAGVGGQAPPPVPGINYSPGSDGVPVVTEASQATPAAPVLPSDAAKIPAVPEGGTTTASLGGSDVAVASVGGSYQVDAPHKKKRRSQVPAP
jgi:hypothetical protein